jgi:hypothetical protein
LAKAEAEDLKNKKASRQGKRTDLLYDNKSDVQEVKAPTGNRTATFLRRLRKDRPDIHARVLAGDHRTGRGHRSTST